ncbi:GMP reductase 1 isoform X4 [Oncorhynchus clarkii lewisi]|uniref:GMP reductase 1 isoform X4 n=1 Tax=Oncorhynchus clarkii lewisi TaxID=490388 RepID=UPI0039B92AF8
MPRVDADLKLDFKDVLFRPKRSSLKSRSEAARANLNDSAHPLQHSEVFSVSAAQTHIVDLARTFTFRNSKQTYHGIPIIAANMDTTGTFEMARVLSKAGNVVTGEMVEELILSGADIIKVGIGPGSVCTTRIKTGVGYPQLSAVIECADSAHGLKGHIISDGGCSCPGDVAKAFGAGADFVMMGGMLAGHDQCLGEVVQKDGKKVKLFYGMSSDTAMKKYVGGVAEYRASEGRTVEVPYRGDVENTIRDILGGLRSTCTYVGAAKLKELSRRTTFIRVTQQASTMFH